MGYLKGIRNPVVKEHREIRAESLVLLQNSETQILNAQTSLKAGHYHDVVFHAQMAVELALKAAVRELTGQRPPRIHNLIVLHKFVRTRIRLTQDDLDGLARLTRDREAAEGDSAIAPVKALFTKRDAVISLNLAQKVVKRVRKSVYGK